VETPGENRRDIAVVVGDFSEARDSIAPRPGAPGFGRAIRSAAWMWFGLARNWIGR